MDITPTDGKLTFVSFSSESADRYIDVIPGEPSREEIEETLLKDYGIAWGTIDDDYDGPDYEDHLVPGYIDDILVVNIKA